MGLYSSLRSLAYYFGRLRSIFDNIARAISGVFIIGQYLSGWFSTLGGIAGLLEGAANNVAADWYDVYRWLINNIHVDGVLADLLRYADDLIRFIRYPFEFIGDTIRNRWPSLARFADDPVTYVLEVLYRYTGLSYNFIHDPRSIVQGWVRELVGDVLTIARDPRGWLIDKLNDLIPGFHVLITNAGRWLRDRIEDALPDLDDFLRDPETFILDRMVSGLERLADRYGPRLVKIAEAILQKIF